jgi:hypothetical protein
MITYLTSRFSKILTLLVGVCLIGSAFHIHQFHPDYRLQDQNIPLHINVEQPDCLACMNLMQALPSIADNGNTVEFNTTDFVLFSDQIIPSEIISDLNNKSPPTSC